MNGLLWIVHRENEIKMGFNSLADAESFLRKQSGKPAWLAQWDLKLDNIYGRTLAVASTTEPVTLQFQ